MKAAVAPPAVILCYHRIFQPAGDPHLLAVSPERFREHLEVVRRIARPLGLDQLLGGEGRGVVFTFDDGYRDNLENALPLLRAANIPATIYIATGYTGTNREFWWDDLERLIGAKTLPERLRLELNGRMREWNLSDKATGKADWSVLDPPNERTARQRIFCDLHAALRPLPAPRQEEGLAQLRVLTGAASEARSSYRALTAAELKTLAAEPLITLGAHTVSHCDLVSRTPAEQQSEIAGSKAQLEEIIGHSVEHFSYPYGSCNETSVAACVASHFRSAVTCEAESVRRESEPYRLPRFLVRNWDGAEFERQLKDFFRG